MIECCSALLVIGGCLPVVVEWSTPDSKVKLEMQLFSIHPTTALISRDWTEGWYFANKMVQTSATAKTYNFHDDIRSPYIDCCPFDYHALLQVLSESPVEQEKAGLRAPLHSTHALLDEEDSFAPPGSFIDFVRS